MNILLAVDGSEPSAKAVQAVASRPWPADSAIRVLTVVENTGAPAISEVMIAAGGDLGELTRQHVEDAEKLVGEVSDSLRNTGAVIDSVVRQGSPSAEIVEEAEEWPADLIVLGSHGYTGIKRLVLGSVAGSVTSHALCSVEVVRDQRAATHEEQPAISDRELAGSKR